MSQFFISYSRKDLGAAEKIISALSNDDLKPWVDWKSIPKGERLEEEIYHGIEESEIFLFLISPASVQSKWCGKEVDHAIKTGKRILPIVLRDTEAKSIHEDLLKRNWVFCRYAKDDFSTAIEEIRNTIQIDHEWLRFSTKLQLKAMEWQRNNDDSFLLRGRELINYEQQFKLIDKNKDPQPTELQKKYVLESREHENFNNAKELERMQALSAEQTKRAEELNTYNKKLRNFSLILVALLVTAVLAGIVATFLGGRIALAVNNENISRATAIAEATRSKQQSDIALARQLAVESLILADKNPIVATLLAQESVNISPTDEGRNAIGKTFFYHSWFVEKSSAPISAYITSIKWSPDQRKFAYTTRNHLNIWDAEKGTTIRVRWYSESISDFSWSPYGNLIVVVGGDVIRVFDANNGRSLEYVNPTSFDFDQIKRVAWSPQGNYILVGNGSDRVFLFDALKMKQIGNQFINSNDIVQIDWSPNGNWVAVQNTNSIKIKHIGYYFDETQDYISYDFSSSGFSWDAGNSNKIALVKSDEIQIVDLTEPANPITKTVFIPPNTWVLTNSIGLDPSGKSLAVSFDEQGDDSDRNDIAIIDINTGSIVSILKGGYDATDFSWSPDGQKLVSTMNDGDGSSDSLIYIWAVNSGNRLFENTSSVSISPDEKYLIVGLLDRSGQIYDLDNNSLVAQIKDYQRIVLWRKTGGLVYLDNRDFLVIMDSNFNYTIKELPSYVRDVSDNINGSEIAIGLRCCEIILWNEDNKSHFREINTLNEYLGELLELDWDPQKNRLISIHDNNLDHVGKVLNIWDPDSKETLYQYVSPGNISLSPNFKYFVAMSESYNIEIVDLISGKLHNTVAVNSWGYPSWSPDSNFLFIDKRSMDESFSIEIMGLESDRVDEVWDVTSKNKLYELESGGYPIWSPTSTQLALMFEDDIRIINIANGQQLISLQQAEPVFSDQWHGWSPDGKKFTSLSKNNNMLVIWETDSWSELVSLSPNFNINGFYWSPLGTWGLIHIGNNAILVDRRYLDKPCSWLPRNLTHAEWMEYVGDIDYRATCPNLLIPDS